MNTRVVGLCAALLVLSLAPAMGQDAECVPAPSGLVGWWPGDGNALDVQGSNYGILVGTAAFAAGKVSSGFFFDGGNGYVEIADASKPAVRRRSDRRGVGEG